MSGRDGYGANLAEHEEILAALVNLQRDVAGVALAPDVPDWRGDQLAAERIEWPNCGASLARDVEGHADRGWRIDEESNG